MRPEAARAVSLAGRLAVDRILQPLVQDRGIRHRLAGKYRGLLQVVVLAKSARRIARHHASDRQIDGTDVRDVAKVVLPLRVMPQAAQRVRVIVDGHARRQAKGRNPQQVAGPHMQRAGQDMAFVLKNVPRTHTRRSDLALVLPAAAPAPGVPAAQAPPEAKKIPRRDISLSYRSLPEAKLKV